MSDIPQHKLQAMIATLTPEEQQVAASFIAMQQARVSGDTAQAQGGNEAEIRAAIGNSLSVGGTTASGARVHSAERKALPPLYDATFEQWLANVENPTHTIMSFDPSVWDRDDVLPSVTLCGGMGGVKKGSICNRGD